MIPLKLYMRNFMCYREQVLDLSGIHLACLGVDGRRDTDSNLSLDVGVVAEFANDHALAGVRVAANEGTTLGNQLASAMKTTVEHLA